MMFLGFLRETDLDVEKSLTNMHVFNRIVVFGTKYGSDVPFLSFLLFPPPSFLLSFSASKTQRYSALKTFLRIKDEGNVSFSGKV